MHVFVYGTLTDRETAADVLDEVDYRGRAVLDGLHRIEGRYPTLAPGGSVNGRLLAVEDPTPLDRYESVADGLYVRVTVPVAGTEQSGATAEAAPGRVDLYVGDPDEVGAAVSWTGDGSFAERVRSTLADESVVVRPDPDSGAFQGFSGYDGDAKTDVATAHDTWGLE